MELLSGDKLSCKDYCMFDSGHNCLMCSRLDKTELVNIIVGNKKKLDIMEDEMAVRNIVSAIKCQCKACNKYLEDYIVQTKLILISQEVTAENNAIDFITKMKLEIFDKAALNVCL